MLSLVSIGLLWVTAIGCGVMAGVYFAFSAFVMIALVRIAPTAGIAAMNMINAVILRSPFMPIFHGTTLAAVALGVIAGLRWGERGALALLAGGVIYVFGMYAVTAIFNVPLNNALAAIDPADAASAAMWNRYFADWTLWNHVRMAASAAACMLFILALLQRGSTG